MLIEKFIEENLPNIEDSDDIYDAFEMFWNEQQEKALEDICRDENLVPERFKSVVEKFIFENKKPLREEVLSTLDGGQPSVLERKAISEKIINRLVEFVDVFINGMK